MTRRVTTRTGATYDLDTLTHKVRRNADYIPVATRRADDNIWLIWLNPQMPVVIGDRMVLFLAGPTGGPFQRITTPVVSIEELDS